MADKPEEKPQIMPWQEGYQLKPNQPITPATVKAQEGPSEAPGASVLPWEQEWKERPRPSLPDRPKKDYGPLPMNPASIESYLNKVISVESSGDPNAKNPNSTATGLGQFIESTWKEQVALSGKNYTLADRKDPEKAKEILQDFTQRNMKQARADLGRAPDNTELYMYHFLGSGQAGSFIKAPKDEPATKYVDGATARANRAVFYSKGQPKTVGEVINQFRSKF